MRAARPAVPAGPRLTSTVLIATIWDDTSDIQVVDPTEPIVTSSTRSPTHPDDIKNGWQVPTFEVDAKVNEAFEQYNVVGFYADPARWESYVADWEAKFARRLKIGRKDHPIQWWMTGGRGAAVAQALKQFETAVVQGEMTHSGSSVLTRHALNARVRITRGQRLIGKKYPESEAWIDAAIAAVLAWQARLDAIAKGLATTTKPSPPRRLR
jgi:hypothetical protein